jgi:hypothetical protein
MAGNPSDGHGAVPATKRRGKREMVRKGASGVARSATRAHGIASAEYKDLNDWMQAVDGKTIRKILAKEYREETGTRRDT